MQAKQMVPLLSVSIFCGLAIYTLAALVLLNVTASEVTATSVAWVVGTIWVGSIALSIRSGLRRMAVYFLTRGTQSDRIAIGFRSSCFPRHSTDSPSLFGVHDLSSYVETITKDEMVSLAVKLEAATCQGLAKGVAAKSMLGGLLMEITLDQGVRKHLLGLVS